MLPSLVQSLADFALLLLALFSLLEHLLVSSSLLLDLMELKGSDGLYLDCILLHVFALLFTNSLQQLSHEIFRLEFVGYLHKRLDRTYVGYDCLSVSLLSLFLLALLQHFQSGRFPTVFSAYCPIYLLFFTIDALNVPYIVGRCAITEDHGINANLRVLQCHCKYLQLSSQ